MTSVPPGVPGNDRNYHSLGVHVADHIDTINLNDEMKDDLRLAVSCAGVRHYLDRESVIAQSAWFANAVRKDSTTIATMQGFAMTFLKIVDVQHETFEYIVSFLRTGLYVPRSPPADDPWQNLPLHTEIYSLALHFQLPKLKSFTIAAFRNDITQEWPQCLEPYIRSLRLLFADQRLEPENDIEKSPDRTTLKSCAIHHLAKYFPLFLEDELFRNECRFDRFRVLLLHALAYDESLTDSICGKVMRAYFENQKCSHGETGVECCAGFTRDIFDFVAESLSTDGPLPFYIKPLKPLFDDSSTAGMSKETQKKLADDKDCNNGPSREEGRLDPTATTFKSCHNEGMGKLSAAAEGSSATSDKSKGKLKAMPEDMHCDDGLSEKTSQPNPTALGISKCHEEIGGHTNLEETPEDLSVAAKEHDSCSASHMGNLEESAAHMDCDDDLPKERFEPDPTMASTSPGEADGEYITFAETGEPSVAVDEYEMA